MPEYKQLPNFNKATRICAYIIIVFVLIVQIQWEFGFKNLSSFGKKFIPMAEETALLFFVTSFIFLFLKTNHRFLSIFLNFLIVYIGFVGAITLYDIFTGYQWGGSDFIGSNSIIIGNFQTGKMSFVTATLFILISISFVLLQLKRFNFTAFISLFILFIGYLIFVGYANGVPFLYDGSFVPISWPASIVFIVTAIGLLISAGSEVAPMCYFIGTSTKSLLLRNLMPTVFLFLLVVKFFNALNAGNYSVTGSIISCIIDVATLIVIGVFISYVSRGIGNSIDNNIRELKEAEEKLLIISEAVEQSPVAIVITNINGNILFVNPKFSEISGYTKMEVIGKNPRILKSGFTSDDEYKSLWQTIMNGKTWNGQFQNIRKSGEMYWENATISAIKNDQGDIIRFIALKEDINARRIVEEKLKKIAWKQSHEIRGPLSKILGIISAMNFKISLDEKLFLLNQLDVCAKELDNVIKTIVLETQFESPTNS
jgi:PAS domain S-box-containing protein